MDLVSALWLLGAIVVALVASREFGRSALGWLILALVTTPLVGVVLILLPPKRVPCEHCAEMIKPSAAVCRFCGRSRTHSPSEPVAAPVRMLLGLALIVGFLVVLSRCEKEIIWWPEGGSLEVEHGQP